MARKATGELREHRDGRFSARLRLRGERTEVDLGHVTRAAATERMAMLVELAATLRTSPHTEQNRALLALAGTVDGRRWSRVVAAAEDLAAGRAVPVAVEAPRETVATFAHRWTSGALHREYPDHVRAKTSAHKDAGVLGRHVLPVIGDLPIAAVTLEHADKVLARLPTQLARATRRHVAQALRRLLSLAVYPARLREGNPLPTGWLPQLGPSKAKDALYPEEDAVLLGCLDVPLVRRLAYGLMCREGFRVTEVARLEWADMDLERGFVRLDKNKTKDPRAWDLARDTTNALRTLREMFGGSGRVLSIPGERLNRSHLAEWLRDDLRTAGIRRPELFANTSERMHVRAHDMRATFVTLSLAAGRSETWISDRTGHRSSAMIRTYHRASRRYATAGLVALAPLGLAIPELRLPQDCPKAFAPNTKKTNTAAKTKVRTMKVKKAYYQISNLPVAGSIPAGRTKNQAKGEAGGWQNRPKSPECLTLGAIVGANDGAWQVAS